MMGAPKKQGEVFYLGRVRHVPGLHSQRSREWLEAFSRAGAYEKMEMVEQLLAGNDWQPGQPAGTETETKDVTRLLDDLFS